MKAGKTLTGALVALATAGLCVPPAAVAEVSRPRREAVDVALLDGGVLLGQVVDSQGTAAAGTPVVLRYQDREVVVTQTETRGYFAVKGLRAGVYQVASGRGYGVYRLWAPGTAPPGAHRGALIVAGDEVVRGQFGGGGLKALFANPWIVAGIVATAVAVPVAVHNSQRSHPASP